MDQTQDLTNQPHKSIKKYDDTCIRDYLECQCYFNLLVPPAISLRVLSKSQNWVATPVILKIIIIRLFLNFYLNPSLLYIPFRNKRIWPESSD